MRSWFYWPGTAIIGFVARLLWGARVEGSEQIPREGPFILVANHSSNLDPLILGWAVGNRTGRMIHFMAKAEMLRWPVLGWLATQSAVFFVRRGEGDRSAQRFALEALATGRPIALHPEGTRSRDGHLQAGKSGAAFLAMRSRAEPSSRISVRVGQPFTLPHVPEGRIDRTALAAGTERIMAAIAELLPESQRPLP